MNKIILTFAFLTALTLASFAQPGPTAAPRYMGKRAADPASCSEGSWYYNTASHAFKYCSAANTWSALGGGGGLTTGSAVTGGGASRVLFEDASQNLATAAIFGFDGSGAGLFKVGTQSSNAIRLQPDYGILFEDSANQWLRLGSASQVTWDVAANGATLTPDTGLKRIAAGVAGFTNGSSGTGWMQTAGISRVNANVTNITATPAAITGLSSTVLAGRKYAGTITLIAKNSTAAEGLQFDFNGGSATFTNIEFGLEATPPGVTLGVVISSAAATALTATTATTTDVVYTIYFTCVINAAGTIIPRFAEVSHTSGTATVVLGSSMRLEDIP
jgi:hypothetical protein